MIDEGYIKFRSVWHRTAPLDVPELNELIRWRKPLYAAGLIGEADGTGYGNISARTGTQGQFLISGTQTGHLEDVGPTHFSLVTGWNFDANSVTCEGPSEASSESMTHAAIYELATVICAVVHVHSNELWVRLRDTVPTTAEDISYGTPQMAREFSRLFGEADFAKTGIAVMAGHEGGLVSIGCTVQEATERILALIHQTPS